jgi:hypothetical protein
MIIKDNTLFYLYLLSFFRWCELLGEDVSSLALCIPLRCMYCRCHLCVMIGSLALLESLTWLPAGSLAWWGAEYSRHLKILTRKNWARLSAPCSHPGRLLYSTRSLHHNADTYPVNVNLLRNYLWLGIVSLLTRRKEGIGLLGNYCMPRSCTIDPRMHADFSFRLPFAR